MNRDNWRTPRGVFERIDQEFGFDLDAAATAEDSLCERWIQNALVQDWKCHAAWLNPPYSMLSQFVSKAWREVDIGHAGCVAALLPVKSDQPWWSKMVNLASEIRFIERRVYFLTDTGDTGRPHFACCLAVFRQSFDTVCAASSRYRATDSGSDLDFRTGADE